jgi:hypothetical protein
MQAGNKNSAEGTLSSTPPPQLEVSLAYQDLPSGLRARQFLDHVLDCCHMAADFHLTLWKLALFHLPEVCEQAVRNACEAGLVLMSLRGDSSLDAPTENWLTQWIALRGDEESALAVLIDTNLHGLDCVGDLLFQLQQVTRPSQVRLFVGFIPSTVDDESLLGKLNLEEASPILSVGDFLKRSGTFRKGGLK